MVGAITPKLVLDELDEEDEVESDYEGNSVDRGEFEGYND